MTVTKGMFCRSVEDLGEIVDVFPAAPAKTTCVMQKNGTSWRATVRPIEAHLAGSDGDYLLGEFLDQNTGQMWIGIIGFRPSEVVEKPIGLPI